MEPFPFPEAEPSAPYDYYDRYPYDDAGGPWSSGNLDRLTHLVLVDGRLVDMWSEPVEGTRWHRHARRFDRERRPEVIRAEPPKPPKPPYDEVLEWLELVVGGRNVLDELDDAPLGCDGLALPLDGLGIKERHRLESAAAQLERAAEEFPDEEMGVVLRRVLLEAWDVEPEVVLRGKSTAHTVAGVCWVAGKVNGAFGPHGPVVQSGLREALALPCALSSAGSPMRRALQGFLDVPLRCPAEAPDLLSLGRTSLLTSSTRRMLIRLRNRAVEAKRIHDGSELLP